MSERTYDALRAEILTYGCHVDTPAWSYCWYCGATAGRGRPTAHAPDCLWQRLTRELEEEGGARPPLGQSEKEQTTSGWPPPHLSGGGGGPSA